jgi:TPR repeat protein
LAQDETPFISPTTTGILTMKKYMLAIIPFMMLCFAQASMASFFNTAQNSAATSLHRDIERSDGEEGGISKADAKRYYDDAQDYLEESNGPEALKYFKWSAEGGYDKAQYAMGKTYESSFMVTTDYAVAREWYLKAAKQNNTDALNALGAMSIRGRGVKSSYEDAFEWYKKSAQLRDPYGEAMLGRLFLTGKGTTKNYGSAKFWIEESAEQRNYDGVVALMDIYYAGSGVPKDWSVSYALARYCAKNFDKPRMDMLAQTLAKQMEAGQVGKGEKLYEQMMDNGKILQDIEEYLK